MREEEVIIFVTHHPPINRFVFSFQPNDQPCDGLKGVLERYHAIARVARLSGPTNFAPMIYRAMEIVKESHNAYHILLIICDGRPRISFLLLF